MGKTSGEARDLFGRSNWYNQVCTKPVDDLLRFILAVYENNRVEAATPQRMREPHRIAKGCTITGVNRPSDTQRSITDINSCSLHSRHFHTNRQTRAIHSSGYKGAIAKCRW